jgi:hypothetical protein
MTLGTRALDLVSADILTNYGKTDKSQLQVILVQDHYVVNAEPSLLAAIVGYVFNRNSHITIPMRRKPV